MKDLYGERISDGQISEILSRNGGLLGNKERVNYRIVFVSDKIFGRDSPVLVVVEPLSGYIFGVRISEGL